MHTVLRLSWCVLLIAGLSACAPGFSNNLSVEFAEEQPRDETVSFYSRPVRVSVGHFLDHRESFFIGEVNGRSLLAKGNVPLQVKKQVERSLNPRGVSINANADVELSGSIEGWYVKISTGFPMSKAQADAALHMTIVNRLNGQKYTATYTGQASISHPFLGQSNVEKMLAKAMQSALDSALEDGEFLAALGVL